MDGRSRAWLLRAATLIAAIALLGPTSRNDVQRYLQPLVQQRDFSGVVLIAGKSGILLEGNFGTEASPQATYAVGSISKTFTAAAIELLASRGKLSYNDMLDRFVPEYRYAKDITIDELLKHRAGIPDYYSLRAFAEMREKNLTLSQIAQWLNAFPLDFKPGTKGRYSNSGYSLLALVIERVSGQKYNDFLADNIFTPLRLEHTSAKALDTDVPGFDPGPAPSLVQPAAKLAEGWLVGNGSIRSNATDLSRWLDVAAAGAYINFKSLSYPDGWSRQVGSTILEQDGRIPGFAADISIDEATGMKVVVLSNIQCAVVETMASDLRKAYGGDTSLPQHALRSTYQPTPAALAGLGGNYGLPGLPLVVTPSSSGLTLSNANDGMQLPLDSVGPKRFFFRPLYVYVTFQTDSKGIAKSIDWAGQFSIPKLAK